MTDSEKRPEASGTTHAYATMLERVKQGLENTEDDIATRLHYVIDAAKEKTYELGELTREESDKVGDYLKRDIQDATRYLAQEGKQLSDWLKFDIELVEARLAEVLSETLDHAVNSTDQELKEWAETATRENRIK